MIEKYKEMSNEELETLLIIGFVLAGVAFDLVIDILKKDVNKGDEPF